MDEFGRTDIFYAIRDGEFEEFLFFLKNSDVNAKDKEGNTLLNFAIIHSRFKIAQVLLEQGANTEIYDQYGNGPMWRATFQARGSYKFVKLLSEFGADPNHKNTSGKSSIDFANTIGDQELVDILKANKAKQ